MKLYGDMGQVRFTSFAGKQSEDFVKLKKSVKRNFDFLEWEPERCARLPTILTGKALRVYESLSSDTVEDIDSLWKALENFSLGLFLEYTISLL